MATQARTAQISDPPQSYGMARQAIMNGGHLIAQRGTSFATPSNAQYYIDRYQLAFNEDGGTLPTTHTHSQAQTQVLPGVSRIYRITVDGAGSSFGTNADYRVQQKIENGTFILGTNASQDVTLSFWARSSISGKKLAVNLGQYYGSGGSPTAEEIHTGSEWTLTANFVRYSHTFTLNTIFGKTFGTDLNDHLRVQFHYMYGATTAAAIGAAGAEDFVGSGTIDIAGLQFNLGSEALPFEPKSQAQELADCQRYRQVFTGAGFFIIGQGSARSTTSASITIPFFAQMRATPTLIATGTEWSLLDGFGAAVQTTAVAMDTAVDSQYNGSLDVTVASGLTAFRPYRFAGDNAGTRTMIFSAEQ